MPSLQPRRASPEQVAAQVRLAPPRCGATRLVCIDGAAGSGKTTLSARLSELLDGAPVVHCDDLYEGWAQDLGQPLAARIEAWLLLAWEQGLPGNHLHFDWVADRFDGWREAPVAPVVILEGCGSGSALIRRRASVMVWVSAPAAVRLARGIARDGSHQAALWAQWQACEDSHFAADGTAAAADFIWDTSDPAAS